MTNVRQNPEKEPSLEQLAARAKQGDKAARQELAQRMHPDLLGFIRIKSSKHMRSLESSSDMVQSVCGEVFEDLRAWEDRGPGSFKAWLFQVAWNKVRQKYARFHAQKRDCQRDLANDTVGAEIYRNLCDFGPSPSQEAAAAEQAERIEAAMDRLPEDYREVILQKRMMGLSHAKIAERMGRSEAAVRSLLNRAKVRLLAELEGRGDGPVQE